MTEVVLRDLRPDGVLVLTLNRPDKLNAWTPEMERLCFGMLAEAEQDPEVRVVVLTGAGRGFCAGADLTALGTLDPSAVTEQDLHPSGKPITYPMSLRKPVIAAINGPVAGIGLVVALYCDVRFAAEDAKITTAFARRGLIAEHGIAWHLPRLVGTSRALDLLLSSRTLLGTEAHRMGLVDHVLPAGQVLDAALAYAADMAANCSPTSMAIIKEQVFRAAESGVDPALRESVELILKSFQGEDFREGVLSHLQRRAPQFPPLA
ncbi:enoyl-CoA hydratase-related protein [Kutzneria albida]|uniref:Enoyl-CoA hydratase/isomerase n=1 Tax=Kutzneria albida DSM 43870 TaxID=1449976 RepID=W5WBI7_9PSEU|nr:enoyl-CoA hydratase-related protein [Kutzneria albida]AHH95589.1 enoyl-CoA hydratase/isomerase [Kutzneria albida DSM 43870]